MIADAGFEVEGADQVTLPEHRAGGGCHEGAGACGSAPADAQPVAGEPRTDLVAVRRRGAGMDLAPNA